MSVTILQGDCVERMRTLESQSVQTCVTSPPYFGLRSYLPNLHPFRWFEIGQEKTPQKYVEKLVAVFQEVKRVLRDDGTVWLNLGDSYFGGGNNRGKGSPLSGKQASNRGATGQCAEHQKNVGKIEGLKPKDLIGVPWMVAFALRDDGWYLRSEIIWSKLNPMPESVTDRPTRAHEYIFLLTKKQRYYYDAESIKENVSDDMAWRRSKGYTRGPNGRMDESRNDQSSLRKSGSYHGSSFNRGKTGVNGNGRNQPDEERKDPTGLSEFRNKRDVWTIPTHPYGEAHFATFPPDLIRPCILAGSKPGDTVLDPFGGSGTVGEVALEYGRKAILIELNPAYIPLIERRTNVTPGLPI